MKKELSNVAILLDGRVIFVDFSNKVWDYPDQDYERIDLSQELKAQAEAWLSNETSNK